MVKSFMEYMDFDLTSKAVYDTYTACVFKYQS